MLAMAATIAFLVLVVAPCVWGHSVWWFFPAIFVGLPVTVALLPEEKPTRASVIIPCHPTANEAAELELRYQAAIAEWEERHPRWWRRAAPSRQRP